MESSELILGTSHQPKTKSELIRRLNQINNIDFKLFENVERKDVIGIKNEIERSISNKDTTILIIKKTR